MRLDQAIAARFPEISRRRAKSLLAEHRVLLNDRPVSAASRNITDADRITIVEDLPLLPVIASTPHWIAIDKPAGLPVQPTKDRRQRSAIEILGVQLKKEDQSATLFLLHRIDTGTTGVVLFARTRSAAAKLSRLFSSREMQKTYLALLQGVLEESRTVEDPIDGQEAITHLEPLETRGNETLVQAKIDTGRTHQIRVHAAAIGHPVVGDGRYGSGGGRLRLHAWKLAHPLIGELVAPPPSLW